MLSFTDVVKRVREGEDDILDASIFELPDVEPLDDDSFLFLEGCQSRSVWHGVFYDNALVKPKNQYFFPTSPSLNITTSAF